MKTKVYRVAVQKEQFTFSAAHFITYGENVCERLHGHNYGVRCEVFGRLNEHGYVADFIAIRDQLLLITTELDHRVLLPTRHDSIRITQDDAEVTATFAERRWVFPLADCILLPIANTTAELLAGWIADRMLSAAPAWATSAVDRIRIGVDENQGQWGECEVELLSP